MTELARCPACLKHVAVTAAGTFGRHRVARGAGNGMCRVGILDRVRVADRLHRCARCAELEPVPDGVQLPPGADPVAHGFRPLRPRATTGTRPPLCFVHRREADAALKARRRARSRERDRGLPEADRGLLWELQGRACACCGRRLNTAKRAPTLDHCHVRAQLHDHPDDQACRRCARGLVCVTCNRQIIGDADREPTSLVGRYIAGDNPAADLGWWDFGPEDFDGPADDEGDDDDADDRGAHPGADLVSGDPARA